jgi:hypothetical protein
MDVLVATSGTYRTRAVSHAASRPESASESRAAWRAATSFDELCELGARFVEGQLAFFPGWNAPDLDDESDEIALVLARLCRAGFLTVASQPARARAGGAGQRAFVCGFVTDQVARRLEHAPRVAGLVVEVHGGADAGAVEGNVVSRNVERADGVSIAREPVSLHGGVAHAFAGHDAREEEIVCFEDHVSKAALDELRSRAWVSAYDLEWGRKDALWAHLARALHDE